MTEKSSKISEDIGGLKADNLILKERQKELKETVRSIFKHLDKNSVNIAEVNTKMNSLNKTLETIVDLFGNVKESIIETEKVKLELEHQKDEIKKLHNIIDKMETNVAAIDKQIVKDTARRNTLNFYFSKLIDVLPNNWAVYTTLLLLTVLAQIIGVFDHVMNFINGVSTTLKGAK